MKISVIVPVYNAEKHLPRCVESIRNQSYENLEIILINDGSTDSSPLICDNFKKKDSRIKVIHQKNRGQSSARNAGLEIVTGEYITFVDSDDWIVNDIYQHSIDLISEYNCDVVDFQPLSTVNPNETVEESKKQHEIEVVKGRNEILYDYMLKGQNQKSPFTVWRKVFNKELFNNIQFIEGMINEDIVINFELLMKSNVLVHTEKVGYIYFQSTESTTRNGLRKRDFDLLAACERLKKLNVGIEDERITHLIEVKYARSYFSLLAKIAFYGVEDPSINEKETVKMLTKKLRENYILLMQSPMPVNRKLMVTALTANYHLLAFPLSMYKKVKGN